MEMNPELFSSECEDAEQLTITMFVIIEKVCVKDSEWLPYINMLPDIGFFCDWPISEIEATQDVDMIKWANEFKTECDLQWGFIKSLLQTESKWFYPFLDENNKVTAASEHLFRVIYAQVCTRCFGITFDKAACIPFADLLNHTHTRSGVFLANKELHMRPLSVKGYYKKELYLTNVSMIYEEEELKELDEQLVNGFDGGNLKF
jgi:hypothetical protein